MPFFSLEPDDLVTLLETLFQHFFNLSPAAKHSATQDVVNLHPALERALSLHRVEPARPEPGKSNISQLKDSQKVIIEIFFLY